MADRRGFVAACVLVALLGIPAVARAQEQRLFAVIPDGMTFQSQLVEVRIVSGIVVSVTPRATIPSGGAPVVTAGAQFLVWPSETGLVVFDRNSSQLSIGPDFEGLLGGVSDPTRPRVFSSYGLELPSERPVGSLTPAGLSILPGTAGLSPRAVSADGHRLYTVRTAFPAPGVEGLAVVDTATGQAVKNITFTTPIAEVGGLAVSRDGTLLWLLSVDCWSLCATRTWTLRRFDLNDGIETLTVPFAPVSTPWAEFVAGPVFDEETGRLVVASSLTYLGIYYDTTQGTVIILDTESGAELSRTSVEGGSTIALDPSAHTVVAVSQSQYRGPDASNFCGAAVLRTFVLADPSGPSTFASNVRACVGVAFAATPMAPQLAPAEVSSARTVTLTWTRPMELTTGFVVEAGTAPGLANVASFSTAGDSLVVPNVPPGRYHVRVRARNDIGLGASSNEIVVDVP